jgi:hypothetical protein
MKETKEKGEIEWESKLATITTTRTTATGKEVRMGKGRVRVGVFSNLLFLKIWEELLAIHRSKSKADKSETYEENARSPREAGERAWDTHRPIELVSKLTGICFCTKCKKEPKTTFITQKLRILWNFFTFSKKSKNKIYMHVK